MNEQTQKALDIAKEALFLIRASDPAYNAKTTYRVTNHERFGELLREFFDVEDRIRQAHTEQNLNKHLVMQAEGSDGAKGAAVGQRSVGQSGRVGCVHNTLKYIGPWYSCETCGTHFEARAEAPSEGALDF